MSGKSARAAMLATIAGSACNGQFDFDTRIFDAGEEPAIIIIEAGVGDGTATDSTVDLPHPGIHIACGASTCEVAGCCVTNTSTSCIDIAQGDTCSNILIQCDDTDDCPDGEVCCAEGDDLVAAPCTGAGCDRSPRLQRVHCETEAHCRSSNYAILCNPDRPTPCTQCVATSIAGLPTGYHQCAASP